MRVTDRFEGNPVRVGDRIGRGRLGEVFAVSAGARGLALKVYRGFRANPHDVADAMRRAARSGLLFPDARAGRLRLAPAIGAVTVEDAGDTVPGLLMPRARGRPLGEWVETGPDRAVRLEVLGRLLVGLAALHEKALAHNDLSFGNVLVGADVWLIDFDRAGDAPPPLARAGLFYDRVATGPAEDVRAFVCLAAMVLSGRHPFIADPARFVREADVGAAPFSRTPEPPSDADLTEFYRLALAGAVGARDLLPLWPGH
ncbi:hypothetical protein LVO79_05920 [Roseivivax marinus]|uniref:hypothetical protein n=1 Tax=Roseivivax marinus TaxID=1379903 RepID=UPI001F0431AF|nr:hypothetical protein [Roseivivax marinus]UMA65981.1 hypothetical protein LVO79_05920 [Roseivivax marinus]